MRREVVLAVALLVSLPAVAILGGCLKGTTAGAGRAKVTTPDEASKAQGASISQTDDKFAGVTVTNLRNNRLPDPSGNLLQDLYFDATCVSDACYVVLRLAGLAGATNEVDRLHLVIDGRQYPDLVGRPSITVNGHTVRGDLVVPLDADVIGALNEATEVEYRVEATRKVEAAMGSDSGRRFEGKLSGENVLNVREMLSVAGMVEAKIPAPAGKI
jgi:hypothetical protein